MPLWAVATPITAWDMNTAMTTESRPAPESPAAPIARDELLAALNELLEAERAGARVAMETGREITVSFDAALVADIHKDEVHWCGMLMRAIKTLGATPSSVTGAFHGKAMAIADIDQRLTFLNRGQAWVVRKLQALIPRVDDPSLRTDLQAMLDAHHVNIARVETRGISGA